jgi:hypothetical protein
MVTANETFRNWRGYVEGKPCSRTVEARLYTDVWIVGEIPNLGPYSFLNTLAGNHTYRQGQARPAVVLRVALHAEHHLEAVRLKNNYEHYHGGDFTDEMAAIASLFLGIRMKAGAVDREFMPGRDPLGNPIQLGGKGTPVLPPTVDAPQIPRLMTNSNLLNLNTLNSFPNQSVQDSNALIKAARMYQQAIWICDSDPSLAWLLLISAVEIAAVQWAGSAGTPAERLQTSMPELYELLQKSEESLIEPVAGLLVDYTKATKKFVDFLVEFLPEPPALRPSSFLRFAYTKEAMKSAAVIIYGHRSKSLHSGTAFPMPMCNPPWLFSSDGNVDPAYQETVMGLATSTGSATWNQKETPMLLNAFEHIARGAILNWWQSLKVRSDLPDDGGTE